MRGNVPAVRTKELESFAGTISAAQVSYPRCMRRHTPGLLLSLLVNTRVKWLWSTKPLATATSASESSVPRRSCFARSTRRRISHLCGGIPIVCLNARAKWALESPHSLASCLIDGSPSRFASINSSDRRIWHGANPPRERPELRGTWP
jgi:hypothetical protein